MATEETNADLAVKLETLAKELRELDDEALAEIGAWMRWPYVLCASILTVGVVVASPAILWTLSTVAIATVFLPYHPFNYVYNALFGRKLCETA